MIQVICPKCKATLKKNFELGDFKILKCKCRDYPVYKDIIYLIDGHSRTNCIDYIHNHNTFNALKSMLNLPYRLFIPFYFLLNSGLGKILGFNTTIFIMTMFGYGGGWSRYLLNREEIPYYKISLLSLKFVNRKDPAVLDIGCGTGHFLREITEVLKPKNVVGVDISFLNLYLAKYFFTKQKVIYICCDIEKGLPFKNKIFDFIHMADTFQYIKGKQFLLKNISKTIKKTGILSVPHTHQTSTENIIGIKKDLVIRYLENNDFHNIKIARDNAILINLNLSNLPLLTKSDAFSILASKSSLPKTEIFIEKKFIVVSPHLDDAVLSSTFLIEHLNESGFYIEVITLFTRGGSAPYSPQAKYFLYMTGFDQPKSLFKIFKNEDINAMRELGISYKHLNFTDAAFRKDRDGNFIYKDGPIQFSGFISAKDKNLIKQVSDELEKQTINIKNVVFIAPLGIGGHADHIITREALKPFKRPTVYWEDYPYNRSQSNTDIFFAKNKNFRPIFKLENNDNLLKERLIRIYKSQIKMLFPNNKIDNLNERYYRN